MTTPETAMTSAHRRSTPDRQRRLWLQAAAAAPLLGSAATPATARFATKAHSVIAGSGLGGLAVANCLATLLDGARITILDA
jgi:sulfide:quinone oxidoreductase